MTNIFDAMQGSQEWHDFRSKHFGASEASAMLGLSPYKTRDQLLKEKATGLMQDISNATQKVFDNGHAVEALARPMIESQINQDLLPVTLYDGLLSASCDGLTIDDEIAWECKQYNDSLFESIKNGLLPDHHQPQCQQVLMLTGATSLIFTCSDGTPEKTASMTVSPSAEWADRLLQGWAQFKTDLDAYEYTAPNGTPVADAIMQLPAVNVQASGGIIVSNLPDILGQFDAFLGNAKTVLTTDDDFANGEQTAKFSRETAKKLKLTAKSIVDQIASVSDAIRTLELYAQRFDDLGLKLEKLVKTEKEVRKMDIIKAARDQYTAHLTDIWDKAKYHNIALNLTAPDFIGAIKGKSKLDSIQAAANACLANAKIEASAEAEKTRKKLDWFNATHGDAWFLFADMFSVINNNGLDSFQCVIESRVNAHNQKLEAERDARAKAEAERDARAKEITAAVPSKIEPEEIIERSQPPTREQLINAVATHFNVDHQTALMWLNYRGL